MLMKLLDLFCGEGLAAWGYWRSGRFTEIVGVDISNMKPRYAFDFVQGDALALDYKFLMQFDFIHASPPCQAYSKMTPREARKNHPKLIAGTHLMLVAAGKPYVIENVEGSGRELKPNLILSGQDVGLPMLRKRYFHLSSGCRINLSSAAYVNELRATNLQIHGGDYVKRDTLIEAFGLETIPLGKRRVLTREGIEQGIPPAFTRMIAEMLFPDKALIA